MSSGSMPAPEGPGSVSGAPNLPDGFAETSTSRFVDTGGVRLHAVVGGDGPPLLLVHGWPDTWYAWRLMMPTLARDFEVMVAALRYHDTFTKPDGRWRFAERRLYVRWTETRMLEAVGVA